MIDNTPSGRPRRADLSRVVTLVCGCVYQAPTLLVGGGTLPQSEIVAQTRQLVACDGTHPGHRAQAAVFAPAPDPDATEDQCIA